MSTYIGTRDYIDLPEWRSLTSPVLGNTITTLSSGTWMAEDYRNNDYSNGLTYFLTSGSQFNSYNNKLDAWVGITNSFGSVLTHGVGSSAVFVPSLGPRGKLTGTNTSTKLNLDSVWLAPAAATWTRSNTVLQVTTTSVHGFSPYTAQSLYIAATSDATATGAVGTFISASVNSGTTFTFIVPNTGGTSGTITIGVYVGANQLANRGDGKGCIIRVIGSGAGSSGKTEERHIIGNTAGVTPTIILDEPLSFTPVAGDSFEILSGSFISIGTGGTASNGSIRRFDVATSQLASLNFTNLIFSVPNNTNNILIATDEGYVPHTRKCYEGYYVGTAVYDTANTLTGGLKGCLQATATAAGTITGQASGGDSAILANQYRNYQIRIVEDTTTPTSVGQRRRISSHTAGASPVYTLSVNWTVTPSATAKYVLENWTENILYFVGGTSTMYNYTHTALIGTGTRDTWSTIVWASKPNTSQTIGAMAFHTFGIQSNELNSAKASNIFLFRGSTNAIDVLDIAGGTTGSWSTQTVLDSSNVVYDAFSTGDTTTFVYNPHTQEGKYMYTYVGWANSPGSTIYKSPIRFDSISGKVERYSGMKVISPGGANYQSKFAWMSVYHDPTNNTKVAFWNSPKLFSGTEFYQTPLLNK